MDVLKALDRIVRREGLDITWAPDYSEPGYSHAPEGVAFADWNPERYKRIGDILEKVGVGVEWSDEWTTCAHCGKAIRTEPDCYRWTPAFWFNEETGESMSEKQLRDEVLITFFAGHETTAQLLTWAWYLFSEHPAVEERFHAELEEKLGGRSPRVDDVEGLGYLRMVMDETLRLYSPVAIMARDALEDDEVGGYQVPAGTIVTLSPYMTHRHPEFWERPLEFYPDHFAPEQVETRPRYAYYPFGAGQRTCLGKHFALLEGALVLAEVGQRYRLRSVPGQEIKPHWSGTLRPDRAVMMVLEER